MQNERIHINAVPQYFAEISVLYPKYCTRKLRISVTSTALTAISNQKFMGADSSYTP